MAVSDVNQDQSFTQIPEKKLKQTPKYQKKVK